MQRARPSPPARRLLAHHLLRPLATTAVRAGFWSRHLRIGVVLCTGTAAMLVVYGLAAPTVTHRVVIAGLALVALVGSPALLLLPIERMVLGRSGRSFFYGWTLLLTLVITFVAGLDGGGSSLLVLLFSLALTYAAVAYPPFGIAALGSAMVLAVGVLGVLDDTDVVEVVVPTGVMGVFVVMATWTARNQWGLQHEQDRLARELECKASTDDLTGCLNRRAFLRRLDVLERSSDAAAASVCLVDLDGFKQVNDTRGHAVGDALLAEVAAALRDAVRSCDAVARLGGDEFALLTEACVDPEVLAERLRQAVARAGRAHGVTASVGVAAWEPGAAVDSVLVAADRAMYAAKRLGGDRWELVGHSAR